MKNLFSLPIVFFSLHAQATELSAHHCTRTSQSELVSELTNYDQYYRYSGSSYEMSILGTSLPLLSMIKSQSKLMSPGSSVVWIVLQPMGVSQAELMPRFLLKCDSAQVSSGAAKISCSMLKSKTHFGVDDLNIQVTVDSNDSKCGAGKTGVNVHVNLSGNKAEIEQVKAEVLKPAGPFKGILSSLFNEDDFFKNYFENFYSEISKR